MRLPALLPRLFVCALLAPLGQAQCEIMKLTGPAPAPAGTWFGFSAALRGELLALGEPAPAQGSPGSVDLLEREAGSAAFDLVASLFPSDGADHDHFGHSVAVDADTLVVGAPKKDPSGAKGAAYVFERQPGGSWSETAKLLPLDDDAWTFGWAVDVEGDRIAVGAKGAVGFGDGGGRVILFERQGHAWVKLAALKPSVSAPGDGFGAALDLDGERLAVGAPYEGTTTSPYEGLAFVFRRQASGAWTEEGKLSPPGLQDGDQFGRDVALDGPRLLAGAPLHDQPAPSAGAAFVFTLSGGAWSQTAKLSPDGGPDLFFGWSVDLQGARAAIGAKGDTAAGPKAGAAYVLEQGAAGWTQTDKLYGSGTGPGATFGNALDLDGAELLIGAPFLDSPAASPGSAFLFALEGGGPSLLAEGAAISLSQGGAQVFQLGACAEHGGHLYLLAGSATGTSPGFVWAGQQVPLNPDAYFLFTLSHPGSAPLAGSFGALDFWGWGSAAFALPAGADASLAGLVLSHAYAVLDPFALKFEGVSPAVSVALLP